MVKRSVLDDIFQEMWKLRCRVEEIERMISTWNPQPMRVNNSDLLSLPDHLRKTYSIVLSKGECEALVVSSISGRCRAVESSYLNQLVRMGWLNKRRVTKNICFRAASIGVKGDERFECSEYPLEINGVTAE